MVIIITASEHEQKARNIVQTRSKHEKIEFQLIHSVRNIEIENKIIRHKQVNRLTRTTNRLLFKMQTYSSTKI